MTLFSGMDRLDFITGVPHERKDLRLRTLIPKRREELTVTKRNRVVFPQSLEQGILDIDMLDKGVLQSLKGTRVDLAPVLNKAEMD